MKKFLKKIFCMTTALCTLLTSAILYYSQKLPDTFSCEHGKKLSLNTFLKISAEPSENLSSALAAKTSPETTTVTLSLMGLVPIKNVEIRTVERPMLTPCGKPFGIKMMMDGVMVIKTGPVETSDGMVSPAEDAGIQKGDIITAVNDQRVYSNRDIEKLISEGNGAAAAIELIRDGKKKLVSITPALSSDDSSPKLGLWVRDSSSGIGTVTYCERSSLTFGGLGHPVCDTDTGKTVPLFSGEIMDVSISDIKKGVPGKPGELRGFFSDNEPCGKLSLNNRYGVFGNISDDFFNNEPVPMALRHEVSTGDAFIYSTLCGDKPEAYDIEIKKIDYDDKDSSKNMIIKIVDPELIEKTGGIVQGMSGSPIIQNGMLVGAVTHVFVNDPTTGYAVFCENMYDMSRAS